MHRKSLPGSDRRSAIIAFVDHFVGFLYKNLDRYSSFALGCLVLIIRVLVISSLIKQTSLLIFVDLLFVIHLSFIKFSNKSACGISVQYQRGKKSTPIPLLYLRAGALLRCILLVLPAVTVIDINNKWASFFLDQDLYCGEIPSRVSFFHLT